MTILLTGATGYVGRHLLESWKSKGLEIHAASRNASSIKSLVDMAFQLHDLDICDKQSLEHLIDSVKPNVIIHTAGMSKPNDCELLQNECFKTNVTATEQLSFLSKKHNAYLIFLSTDFVFGDNGPYSETDNYCPVNYYGKSKQLAEEAVIKSNCSYAILRIVLVYGKVLAEQRPTFLQWVITNLEDSKTLHVYTDQLRTPCYVNDLCWVINQLIQTKEQGIFHICGEEVFTPFSLAKSLGKYINLNTQLILPTNYDERPELAKRPFNATLHIDKAKNEIGFRPTHFALALQEIFG